MRNEDHISDGELLKAADGELAGRHASRIQAHLEACWSCRARRAELERTIEEFVRAHRGAATTGLPAAEAPRALLRARLRQAATSSRRPFAYSMRTPAFASVAFTAVLTLGLIMYFSLGRVGAASTPDTRLTPGVTRLVTKDDVCSAPAEQGFYPIPATLAYRVFEQYRIRNPRPRAYEVDYLITPSLGGADDIRNLWPQPYAAGEWNAHVKDALEDHLHDLVCEGKVELVTAQRDLSVNWIAAYQKYFMTDRPLDSHTEFSIDPPWEE